MGGLFSKPKLPPPPEPVRMPVPDDAESKAAGRRKKEEALSARGRDSTDLSGDSLGT